MSLTETGLYAPSTLVLFARKPWQPSHIWKCHIFTGATGRCSQLRDLKAFCSVYFISMIDLNIPLERPQLLNWVGVLKQFQTYLQNLVENISVYRISQVWWKRALQMWPCFLLNSRCVCVLLMRGKRLCSWCFFLYFSSHWNVLMFRSWKRSKNLI